MLSNLSGKAGELGFTAGITYNKAAVEYYQKQIGDGNDINTQLNNDAILNKDNQKIFDQLNSEPNSFENYTTTNMAVAFSEKINTALKGNNPNEAKKLLEIFSKYMNLQYNQYQKEDAKSLLAVPNVNIDAMAQKAKLPTFLNGNQLSQLFSMFPKGSKEYNEVQKLAGMQQEIYKKVDMDLYRGYYNGNEKDKWLYPGDKNYGMLPDYYKNLGLNANSAQTIKANESRGANAIIGSAISPLGALGSSTRLLGVDDKTADNLAIGGALIGTVVGSGVAIKTGGFNDTPLGKSDITIAPHWGMSVTENANGPKNSVKNYSNTNQLQPSNFANSQKLTEHFKKHGGEFKKLGVTNEQEYLNLSREIIKNGEKVEYNYNGQIRTGYVAYIGNDSKGKAKFALVGTNAQGQITTLHTQSGKDFWKTINGNAQDKSIKVVK